MKAAIVVEAGKTPVYGNFKEPIAGPGEHLITVTAAGLSPLVRGRAAGSHYSASAAPPFIVGVDGVGRLQNGIRVYFVMPKAPFGSMAEKVSVPTERCLPLPEGLDDVMAAAIANPGMSSWAAYKERAKLEAGETVLVNGATGAAGRLAVQIAKLLGAKKVIATGRNLEVLESLKTLGADVTVPLTQSPDELERKLKEQFEGGVDVVLDYLWGKSAESLLIAGAEAGKEGVPIRFIQVGSSSGPNIELPSAVLRSSAICLMGSGLNSVPLTKLLEAIDGLLKATVPGKLKIATHAVPLSEVGQAWNLDDNKGRIVFIPSGIE
jgi:NADPH:quinone reductase-like Zn-dependent oxidoreductase